MNEEQNVKKIILFCLIGIGMVIVIFILFVNLNKNKITENKDFNIIKKTLLKNIKSKKNKEINKIKNLDNLDFKNKKNILNNEYSIKILTKYNDSKQGDILDKIYFYKDKKIYKTIDNNDFGKVNKMAFRIYYSQNKEYFAVEKYLQYEEGGLTKYVEIYNKNGIFQWKASGDEKLISYLSNNGNYYFHVNSLEGACYSECRYTIVTRKYGEDIKLEGVVQDYYNIKSLLNGGVQMNLTGKNGKNYIELDKTGGIVRGRLWN